MDDRLDVDNRVSVGADAQWVNDARKNWANCNGVATANATCPAVGAEKGLLSLDQNELVSSFGPYLRDELSLGRVRIDGRRARPTRCDSSCATISSPTAATTREFARCTR